MINKEQLYEIQDEYVELAFDIGSMLSVLKQYEVYYWDVEKNGIKDTIRVIKNMAESIECKITELNSRFDVIMLEEE